jgi:hypothetical protein
LLVKDEIMSKPDLALPSSINDFCGALGVSFFLKEDISRYRNLLREPIAEKRASLAAELIQELTLREKERLEILSPCEEKRSQQFLSLVTNASSLAKLRGSLPIPSEGWGKKNISRAWSAYSSKAVGGNDLDAARKKLCSVLEDVYRYYGAGSSGELEKKYYIILRKRTQHMYKLFTKREAGVQHQTRARADTKGDRMRRLISELKSNNDDVSYKNLPRIGLGMESTFKPKPVRRDDVSLDECTSALSKVDKSILYVPGWSLASEGDPVT